MVVKLDRKKREEKQDFKKKVVEDE